MELLLEVHQEVALEGVSHLVGLDQVLEELLQKHLEQSCNEDSSKILGEGLLILDP